MRKGVIPDTDKCLLQVSEQRNGKIIALLKHIKKQEKQIILNFLQRK